MAIPIRHSVPTRITAKTRTFFVTSSILEKRNLLQSDRSASLFIKVLHEYRAHGNYGLHEFVVMPDHFHVLVTVDRTLSIEKAVQFIKGGFAFRAGRELGLRAPLWQKGFSEVRILCAEDYERISEYIRNNPVAHRLVAEPTQFPYSSAYPGFQLDPPPRG